MKKAAVGTWLSRAAEVPIEVVFPRRCAGCGRRGEWVCGECEARLTRFAPPWCERCGLPPATHACRCDALPSQLETLRSVGPYEGWLRGAIIAFKYHGERARARHLAEPLAPLLADLGPADALIPVPLHRRRLRQRGFNQAHALAEALAAFAGVPVWPALRRDRATAQQVGLDGEARRRNVAGAFSCPDPALIRDRTVVLIDDVITTGATFGACAEVLRSAGAKSVAALTVARDV